MVEQLFETISTKSTFMSSEKEMMADTNRHTGVFVLPKRNFQPRFMLHGIRIHQIVFLVSSDPIQNAQSFCTNLYIV